MATTYHNAIEQLYLAYFSRPADAAGLAYWEAIAEARQGDLSGVSAAFAASTEYRSTYAGMNSRAIVATIYQNLFGRQAESAGTSYWAGLLASGTLSIDTIVSNIADGARLGDKTAFANKTAAATAFSAALDTPEEIAAYARTDAGAAARAFLKAVTTDASLASAIAPAALDAAIRDILLSHTTLLTAGKDTISSSPGHAVFEAPAVDGQTTLQSGDTVLAQRQTIDTLRAEMAADRIEAVAPVLTHVDRIELHVGAASPLLAALLNASSIQKTTHYVSDRSEADLVIQNIRLTDTAIDEVKVEMRDTAAGDVDLGVYFERATPSDAPAAGSVLHLQLLDARNMESRGIPLFDSPYDRFTFQFNGKAVTVQSARIDAAQHYDELVQAIAMAVAATPGLENVRVRLGADFRIFNTTGTLQQGQEIVLYSVGNDTFGSENAAFGTDGGITFDTIYRNIRTSVMSASAPATSSIILDGVGRGSQGGDLLVGSMLTGGFAEGVPRFDIEVRNSSSLQTIGSTNNALRDITIHNGYASKEADIGKGTLAVMGGGTDLPLPGSAPGASGFTDVRTIDASAMQGAFSFTAAITTASLDKYAPPAGSQATRHFSYTGGTGDDQLLVTIAGDVLGANSQGGTSLDLILTMDGGAGDDRMSLTVTDGASGWYARHAQHSLVMIDAGSGNDALMISGAANVAVDLGSGNDSYATRGAGAGDHTITGGAGDDRITLGTTVGSAADSSSNDTLVYGAGPFGNDVIINFNNGSATAGGDRIDFSDLGGLSSGFTGSAISDAFYSITVQPQTAANDTAAEVAALFPDSYGPHVFVSVDSANVGWVYAIRDTSAEAPTATLVGSIDLAGTPWGTLTGANFV